MPFHPNDIQAGKSTSFTRSVSLMLKVKLIRFKREGDITGANGYIRMHITLTVY